MSALLAFEAAARHESFTYAAQELGLSESAVSRQISALEGYLGAGLFIRTKQRVLLTPAGKLYGTQVRQALDELNRSTSNIIAHHGTGVLELAVIPTLASEWLIPRLPDFYERHPGVRVNMSTEIRVFRFEDEIYEAAIHYGHPTWPRTNADFLLKDTVIPVGKKGYVRSGLSDPQELLNYPLLHSTTRPSDWPRWFHQFGIEGAAPRSGVRYELVTMLISAVRSGLGIALLPDFLVASHMERDGLTVILNAPIVNDAAYYLIYPTNAAGEGSLLGSFRKWLVAQATQIASSSVIRSKP